MNKVTLLGYITMETQLKEFETGKIANSSLATNEYYKDKETGEKKQITEFHSLTAYGKTAELFEKHIKKGQQLFVEGRLKTRSWEADDGSKRYKTDIIVEKIEFIGSSKKEDGEKSQKERNDYKEKSEDMPF